MARAVEGRMRKKGPAVQAQLHLRVWAVFGGIAGWQIALCSCLDCSCLELLDVGLERRSPVSFLCALYRAGIGFCLNQSRAIAGGTW